VQRMSAGTGVTHSEFNTSPDEQTHLLQIWILPERKGMTPSYEQREFAAEERRGRLRVIASRAGREDSLTVHQDVELYGATLGEGDEVAYEFRPGRSAWVQVVEGSVKVNDVELKAGDGAAISEEERLAIRADAPSELLLFDLA